MKSKTPGRKKRSGIPVRVLLRIPEDLIDLHNRYSDVERSEIYSKALKTIFPVAKSATIPPVIIRPLKIKTDTICRILVNDRWVKLFFPEKHDDFRELVKRFRYSWDGCWERQFADSVDIIDRAAEIANELLLGGFCVQVENSTVKDRVIAQSFVPEAFKTIRRVTGGVRKDYFVIDWPRGEDCYSEAMKLTAAKYADGSVYVPCEHFAEIEDFAEINEFVMSEAAIKLASEAKAAREAAIIIAPKRKTRKAPKKNEHSSEIPTHLKDDTDD